MKKINLLGAPVLSALLGVVLLFYSFFFFEIGDVCIAIGVFGLLVGLAYLAFGILDICLGDKTPIIKTIGGYVSVIGYPFYYFIYLIVMLSTSVAGFGFVGWFEIIGLISSSIAIITFTILSNVLKDNSLMGKFKLIFVLIFIALLVVMFVFGFDGQPVVIGELSIPDILLLVAYAGLAVTSQKQEPKEE